MWLQLFHKAFHPRALDLEDPVGLSRSDIIQHILIVIIDLVDVQIRHTFLCHFHGILDHGQRTESEEIHFQKSQLFQCRHRKLGCDRTVGCAGKRYIFIHRLLTDDNAGRMHRAVARQSLQSSRHIDQILHLLVTLIALAQLRIHL